MTVWTRLWREFQRDRRASGALWLLSFAFFASLLAELLANTRPLAVRWDGHWHFPALSPVAGAVFGQSDYAEPRWRELARANAFAGPGRWVLFAPVPYGPNDSDEYLGNIPPTAPDARHWLGTDDRGRDLFARLLYGLRNSLLFAFSTTAATLLVAFLFGSAQGLLGGAVDFCGQRLTELWSALPVLYVLLFLLSVLPPTLPLLALVWMLFHWASLAAFVRADTLRIRRLEWFAATRVLGLSRQSVLFRHVLPNVLVPLLTFAPFLVASAVGALAALDYLGLGLAPPTASWGELLRQGKHNLGSWWLALFPFLALFGTLTALHFVGEGLRNAVDPRGRFAWTPNEA